MYTLKGIDKTRKVKDQGKQLKHCKRQMKQPYLITPLFTLKNFIDG